MKKDSKSDQKKGQPSQVVSNGGLRETPNPARVAVVGLLAFGICVFLGLFLIPLSGSSDVYHFEHWVKANFTFAASPIDLSILSPFQGLAGLMQPIAVWINPAFILPHLIPLGEPRVWSFLVVMILMTLATYCLGRANKLPPTLAVIGAQLITLISFPPFYEWSRVTTQYTGSILYSSLQGVAVPAILGTLFLTVFSYLGTLSKWKNWLCVLLLPLILFYSILCDPLYTAFFFVPIAAFLGGVFLGSQNSSVLKWRILGGAVCLLVCLSLNLHGFYRALTGYAARGTFPNELYVEVQQWDHLAGLFFQGGLLTPAIVLMMVSAIYLIAYGNSQMRGFAVSVLFYQWLMIAVSMIYVYSGIRWSHPLPVYLESGAQSAYMIVGLMGLHLLYKRLGLRGQSGGPQKTRAWSIWLSKRSVAYGSVLILPLIGSGWVLHKNTGARTPKTVDQPAVGIMKFLEDQVALGTNGQFRGSVAMVVGVPGGGMLNRFGVPESEPFNKQHLMYIEGYGTTFAPSFNMTGLWNYRIPTLEDNSILVTPPFHFLISHTLSRPQDFHSRNWAMITKANPKIMAVLGTRYLVTDKTLSDPLLTPVTQLTNADGVVFYLYEIKTANLGNLSPIQTIESTNASQTIAMMTANSNNLNDVAIVYQAPLNGLTRADSADIYYEKGGVRVRAKSQGPCLLVLPVQFSNSLKILSDEGISSNATVQLIRVNLLETGVLFNGEINIKFAHVFGPLRGVRGRLRDIEDCRRLGIKETGDIPYPLDYQPLGRKKQSPTAL